MKKKIFLVLALTLLVGGIGASAVTMYAPDGRTAEVNYWDVAAWERVGWFRDTVITVYAPDGRSQYIAKNQFDVWHAAGWYSEPVMYVYALDGRVQLITTSKFDDWHAVGWYSKPVTTVYARDGRSMIVATEDVPAWKEVGWDYYMNIYSDNGKSIAVFSTDYDKYRGWYPERKENIEYTPLNQIEYSPNGTYISLAQACQIAKNEADRMFSYGADAYNFWRYEWGVDVERELHRGDIQDYSSTSYLIAVNCIEYVEFFSVNKTTGYVFHCGGGQDYWTGMVAF